MSTTDDCSICMESFTKPKGLPCLHTFCLDCLQLHIENHYQNKKQKGRSKDNSFPCPLCRKETFPPNPDAPLKEMAKHFPTNNYVLESSRSNSLNRQHCSTHPDEILDINCKTCRIMICIQCCGSNHENCEKILSKTNIRKLKESLVNYKDSLEATFESLDRRLGCLNENKKSTETRLEEISRELMDFVSKQKSYWTNQINSVYLEESDILQKQKNKAEQVLKMARENITDIQKLIGKENVSSNQAQSPKSDQITLEYQPKYQILKTKSENIEFLKPKQKTGFHFLINKNFEKIKEAILKEHIIKEEEEQEEDMLIENSNCNKSIINTQTNSSIVEAGADLNKAGAATGGNLNPKTDVVQYDESIPREFNYVTHFFLKQGFIISVNDIVLLPDQSILLADACFKKVFKFSINGDELQTLVCKSDPYSFCLLKDDTVAISLPNDYIISIVDFNSLTEKSQISFGKKYFGLASYDQKKIYSLFRSPNVSVDILSKSGGPQKNQYEIIQTIKMPTQSYIGNDYRLRVLPSGRLVVINAAASVNNLTCVAPDGTEVFLYNKGVNSIADIAVSNHFIYIADQATNKIHRIQHGGTFVDIPLTSNDGISQPKKIFANQGGTLVILSKAEFFMIQIFSS